MTGENTLQHITMVLFFLSGGGESQPSTTTNMRQIVQIRQPTRYIIDGLKSRAIYYTFYSHATFTAR